MRVLILGAHDSFETWVTVRSNLAYTRAKEFSRSLRRGRHPCAIYLQCV